MTLIGTAGIRALTHGRVDTAAGLAPGSTSNHFRTRAALLHGVIGWIAEQERADVDVPEIRSEDDLVTALTRVIEVQSAPPLAVRSRARYALFLEADPDTAAPLRAQREGFERWTQAILTSLGGPGAAERAPFLMATCDGLLLHRLTVDPQAPVAATIGLAVAGALRGWAAIALPHRSLDS